MRKNWMLVLTLLVIASTVTLGGRIELSNVRIVVLNPKSKIMTNAADMILDEIEWERTRKLKRFVLLLFFPSFNIWSSVLGKEAIILFCMGVLVSELIRYFKGKKLKFTFLSLISLYVLLMIQDYALLTGSIGLFVALAVIMFLTRRLDWYSLTDGVVLTSILKGRNNQTPPDPPDAEP